jgi:hypothetical protein
LKKRMRLIMKKTKLKRTAKGNWTSLNPIWTTPATFHPAITPMQWLATVSQQKVSILLTEEDGNHLEQSDKETALSESKMTLIAQVRIDMSISLSQL